MTDIPDAISSDSLRSLLEGHGSAPLSNRLPEINFGSTFGGPCDLQFVIATIIAKSTHGVNFIQVLMAAIHLLTEAEQHLAKRRDAIDQELGPELQQLPEAARLSINRSIDRHAELLHSSVISLEHVLEAYAAMSSQVRIDELKKSGAIKADQRIGLDDLKSNLLFSQELLDSLEISRDAITQYLNSPAVS